MVTDKISVLCPTRGRPDNVKRLLQSIKDTAEEFPEVIFYVDNDDRAMREMDLTNLPATCKIGPRICLSECWNECAKLATNNILMHAGDDIIFRTKNWDKLVKQAFEQFPDKLISVYGDDGIYGYKFGTHSFLHRRWMEITGYFVPPYFVSDFNDTWINDVFSSLHRAIYKPFVTEHMHFIVGKGPLDQTHKDRLERHQKEKPQELYQKLLPEREALVEKLKTLLGTPYVPAATMEHSNPDTAFQERILEKVAQCS